MPMAVRFDAYGGVDVLSLVDVPRQTPGDGQVLVAMRAAGLNLGEAKIRQGLLHDRFPTTFPSGQGSDLAGIVEEVGPGVTGVAPGDEVAGFTDERASHAELILADSANLVPKPPSVPWEVAGSLYITGTTAYAAVRAVGATAGDTIVVAGAAGGVGAIACQLALRNGAEVVGVAREDDHAWLSELGVRPVGYGPNVSSALQSAAPRIDGFIDTVGHGYVQLAVELGVPRDRIDTIIDFPAVEAFGVKAEGNAAAASAEVLAELLGLIARGQLQVPIARTFPLAEVQDAYSFLENKHLRGKVVLTSQAS